MINRKLIFIIILMINIKLNNLKKLKNSFKLFIFLKKTIILIILLIVIFDDFFRIKKKNLLISTISFYNWKVIEAFFESFKKSKFKNCDCIMFVNNMLIETINKIKSFKIRVIVHEIPNKFKKMRLINYRWKLYKDFLYNNKNKYNQVFAADVRDTIFQRDIFKYYKNQKSFLGLALEDGKLSYRIDKKWLITAYGKKLYNSIKDERIICAGTVWGTADKFYEFSKIMWEKLSSEKFLRVRVIDQAICNFLIYHEKIFNRSSIIKSENKDGPVMTIGISKLENIHLDLKNNILNEKGKIAAVIHQYDRKCDILKKIKVKFSSDN